MDYLQYVNFVNVPRESVYSVLNLIINGLPSILLKVPKDKLWKVQVLNLIINGLPSILKSEGSSVGMVKAVLNLIINGLPSIP